MGPADVKVVNDDGDVTWRREVISVRLLQSGKVRAWGSGILYFIRSGTTTHRVLIKLTDVSLGGQASVSLCQHCLLRLILH